MQFKLLNLNIFGGKYYDNIVSFIRDDNFDFLCLQELKAGKHGFTNNDILEKLKQDLQMEAEFALTTNLVGEKSSYDGNAIFYKKGSTIINKQIIQLYPYSEVPPNQTFFQTYPRNALSLDFLIESKPLNITTTQLAWNIAPKEIPIQTDVGKKLFNYISTLKTDFILAGDFNLESDSNVVHQFEKFARNLTKENGLTNTLNPRTHRANNLFPKGLAVDFIFTTQDIKVDEFRLVDTPDLSDHFGLSLTFQL